MDFALSDEQLALEGLATSVFTDHATHDRLRTLEREAPTVFDPDLWAACAQAGLLGAIVGEEQGGAGLGFLDLLPVLEAQGRSVAPIPLVETLVLGALSIVRYGTDEQRDRFLPKVVSGEAVLSAGLNEGLGGDPGQPILTGSATGDGGFVVNGTLPFVAYGAESTGIVVGLNVDGSTVLALLDPAADGVAVEHLVATNRQPQASLTLTNVGIPEADVMLRGSSAGGALREIAKHGAAAWCAVQAGVCEGALRMTAAYTSQRKQFDKPIAEFQAVAQRAADAFIDTEMVTLTARRAVYVLSQGDDASIEVHAAKFWAGDGAMRVVHASQHLHGGIGVDLDYPVHRYFLWAKRIEHTLGTPTRELIRLGNILADEPV